MLEVGFFLFKEIFEGKMQKLSILTSNDELFLEPCMNLLFKFLYYYCANYRKIWECQKQKGGKLKILRVSVTKNQI